jgi:hypothetical protein
MKLRLLHLRSVDTPGTSSSVKLQPKLDQCPLSLVIGPVEEDTKISGSDETFVVSDLIVDS